MEQVVLQLAQLLHTVQQQQSTAESVASATMTHFALQLKQLEKFQAEQVLCPSLQQAENGPLEQPVGEIEDQQQQQEQEQQKGPMQHIQEQHSTNLMLQSLQQQQSKLEQQLEMAFEHQQQWQEKQERLLQQRLDHVLQHLSRLQPVNGHIKQGHAADLRSAQQQSQQSASHQHQAAEQDRQQCVGGLEHPTKQHQRESQEECCITGAQEVQQQPAQQQEQGLATLQSILQDLTTKLTSLKDQQQLLQQAMQGADAAAQEQNKSSKQQMEDALARIERRLLHAVRLEAEAQQHIVELKITEEHEWMQRNVAAVQKQVAEQLQLLTNDLQEALTAWNCQEGQEQKQELHELQMQQQAADSSACAASSMTAATPVNSQAAAAAEALTGDASNTYLECRGAPDSAKVSDQQQLRRPEHVSVAQLSSRSLTRNSCSSEVLPVDCKWQSHRRPIAAAEPGKSSSASGQSKARVMAAAADVQQHMHPASAVAGGGGGGGVDCASYKVSLTQKSSRRGESAALPISNRLNDQELDVVLGLLDTLHVSNNVSRSAGSWVLPN